MTAVTAKLADKQIQDAYYCRTNPTVGTRSLTSEARFPSLRAAPR